MRSPHRFFPASALLFSALIAFSPPAASSASAKPPPTAPGHYKDWDGGELEDVEILQSFHLSAYRAILLLPIEAGAVKLPDDNTRVPVQKILAQSTVHFAEELDDDLPNRMKIKVQPARANVGREPGILVLRARFVEMNPGSAAARIFSQGFAGATHITMAGEFIDAATGKTLLRFQHHNYHSKAGLINKYTAALEENEEQIAESVAKLLKAFYP